MHRVIVSAEYLLITDSTIDASQIYDAFERGCVAVLRAKPCVLNAEVIARGVLIIGEATKEDLRRFDYPCESCRKLADHPVGGLSRRPYPTHEEPTHPDCAESGCIERMRQAIMEAHG